MKRYVCGFMFDSKYNEVLLIRKTKPVWQQGKLNGIGGKIESGESPHGAMVREFKEETGIDAPVWHRVCDLSGSDWHVIFYWCHGDIHSAKATTNEQPIVVSAKALPDNIIPNLSWLVPLASDRTTDKDKIYK